MSLETPDVCEMTLYENNLNQLLAKYEKIHANYITSIEEKQTDESTKLLLQLESLNKEIMLVIDEINKKVNKNDNKDEVKKIKSNLFSLNNKLQADEKKINGLLQETNYLHGANATLRLRHKSIVYYMSFYIIVIVVLFILFLKMMASGTSTASASTASASTASTASASTASASTASGTDSDLKETLLLILAIFFILYIFRSTIFGWFSSLSSSVSSSITNTLF